MLPLAPLSSKDVMLERHGHSAVTVWSPKLGYSSDIDLWAKMLGYAALTAALCKSLGSQKSCSGKDVFEAERTDTTRFSGSSRSAYTTQIPGTQLEHRKGRTSTKITCHNL